MKTPLQLAAFRSTRLLLLTLIVAAPRPASAHLLASESFAYPQGQLSGQAGGSGWATAWQTGQPNVFLIKPGSLGGGLDTLGNSLFFDGSKTTGVGARAFRMFDLGPGSVAAADSLVESVPSAFNGTQISLGRPGTSVWLGVVFNGGTAGNGLGGTQYLCQFHLYNGATTTPSGLSQGDNNKDGECLAVGRGNLNTMWNFERTCAHDLCPGGSTSSSGYLSTVTMDNATHWLVMRFDFVSSATTNITTWLDPPAGAQSPSQASALAMAGQQTVGVSGLHFNWIELGGQTSKFSFDEVRLGTSFAELSHPSLLGVSAPPRHLAALQLAAQPNPFIGAATLQYRLSSAATLELRVLDIAGRAVRRLDAGPAAAGQHAVVWDGRDDHGSQVSAGVYLVQLRSPSAVVRARLVRLDR